MITGDHPETARNIALRLGIASPEDRVVTGFELEQTSKIDFLNTVKDIRVYARVSPFQKIRIIQALQARGESVAMTGDGVNDAPALSLAEIGIAMGKGGTDVARESSDITLMDDNFATIVAAVEEGRRVYDNIRKFIRYILTGNFAEILVITLAPFLEMPIPLIPIQILWVNLITDSLPALALANEKGEADAMKLSPRPPKESIFARGLGYYIIFTGLFIAALSLITQKIFINREHWQTIVFTVLSFSQLTQTFSIRSERQSILKTGFLSNPLLLGSFLVMILLQLLIIYVPAFNLVFNTAPLSAVELAYCMVVPWAVFIFAEIIKFTLKKTNNNKSTKK
jgi:Ca2+-transporting ATPase